MPKKRKVAVKLENAFKTYHLHHNKPTLSEKILRNSKQKKFEALHEINLTIYKGQKVGIVGSNGSGKTTLLKIIAGISTLSKGQLFTDGKLVSLIDVSAGFHPDLTGEENIFLNGLVVGMSKQEILDKYQRIIDFADIGEFINSPLYTYSEGMKLRLGTSIAINSDPDIIIFDEGINTGDLNFQKKISTKMKEFSKKKKTIIIVSHWTKYLKDNCDTFILISKGKIREFGGAEVLEKLESY